jgi:chromosome segregation ATPase
MQPTNDQKLTLQQLERYQMNQIKSIADDYNRHQDILEQRKKEIQSLNKEIEKEQSGREAYLADVERKLEKQLQDRQNALRGGALPFQTSNRAESSSLATDSNDPNNIQLTSVDEYAPYGVAPHSRVRAGPRGRARGRGRRKQG